MADNLPRVGSALLVRDEANKILLGQRNKDPQRGCWVLPGGKIRAFEKIAEAAARELREETGLEVQVGDHFGVYEIINPPNEHRIVIYSWAKVVGGNAKASDDLSGLRFFAFDELGNVPLTPLVKQVLCDAGLFTTPVTISKNAPKQLSLGSFPVLIVGGMHPHRKARRHANRHTCRAKQKTIVLQSELVFERGTY